MSDDVGHLALTVRRSETLQIGDEIEISFRRQRGSNQFAILVSAPKSMKISRKVNERVVEEEREQLARLSEWD